MNRLLWMAAVGSVVLAWPAYGQESTRKDFEEFCRAWEGRWVGDVTWVTNWEGVGNRGEKVTAYFEGRVVNDGHAMIGTFFGGDGSSTSLIFYDPGMKRIRWIWVDSGGTMNESIMYRHGEEWKSEGIGSKADGTKITFTNSVRITDGGDTHTWTGTGTDGDQAMEQQNDVWRRVGKSLMK